MKKEVWEKENDADVGIREVITWEKDNDVDEGIRERMVITWG